ncbi:MAG: hypothetical protein R6T99_02095 [Bacteroidales bacterium]
MTRIFIHILYVFLILPLCVAGQDENSGMPAFLYDFMGEHEIDEDDFPDNRFLSSPGVFLMISNKTQDTDAGLPNQMNRILPESHMKQIQPGIKFSSTETYNQQNYASDVVWKEAGSQKNIDTMVFLNGVNVTWYYEDMVRLNCDSLAADDPRKLSSYAFNILKLELKARNHLIDARPYYDMFNTPEYFSGGFSGYGFAYLGSGNKVDVNSNGINNMLSFGLVGENSVRQEGSSNTSVITQQGLLNSSATLQR